MEDISLLITLTCQNPLISTIWRGMLTKNVQ